MYTIFCTYFSRINLSNSSSKYPVHYKNIGEKMKNIVYYYKFNYKFNFYKQFLFSFSKSASFFYRFFCTYYVSQYIPHSIFVCVIPIDSGNRFLFISHFIPFLSLLTESNDDFTVLVISLKEFCLFIVDTLKNL